MFDLATLRRAVEEHGRVVRVVVAEVAGSAPREVGAAMLVWDGGTDGTIGGGALEWEAIRTARTLAAPRLRRQALGPDLGQCCGGRVALFFDLFEAEDLETLDGPLIARATDGSAMPFAVKRLLARARSTGDTPRAQLIDGWMVELVAPPRADLWIWGAGHVGRALVAVMAPLPGLSITWVDTGADRFPPEVPQGVTILPAADPALLATRAPADAHHLILTYSHAIDLALCDALLWRGFASAGLIGSATKWARFRRRLRDAGHPDARIARITCPIGDPSLGKHPQEIAVGVAAALLGNLQGARQDSAKDATG